MAQLDQVGEDLRLEQLVHSHELGILQQEDSIVNNNLSQSKEEMLFLTEKQNKK